MLGDTLTRRWAGASWIAKPRACALTHHDLIIWLRANACGLQHVSGPLARHTTVQRACIIDRFLRQTCLLLSDTSLVSHVTEVWNNIGVAEGGTRAHLTSTLSGSVGMNLWETASENLEYLVVG